MPGNGVLRRHVKQPDEPIGLLERQRPQQHGVDDAEDRGVGADAEREHARSTASANDGVRSSTRRA